MLLSSIATPISVLSAGLLCLQASASPISLAERAANSKTLSGQWDTQLSKNGNFVIENNQWGLHTTGASGSQTTTVDTTSNDCVWSTTYQFSGAPYSVKSYTNAARTSGLGKKLSAITSIPTHWTWTYTHASSDLVADVSWDLWLSPSATGKGADPSSSSFEIMVWLSARGGASPAGQQIATAHIHGMMWKVYAGEVSTWKVYSFVAPQEVQDYRGNLLPFFTYLKQAQGLPDHYFVQAQAGTEPFVGSATLQTTSYEMNVHSSQ
ncbi:hypothetical protein HDU87_006402 [Geranomyces variabilis]|uniref:Uncharacterized protein n=1 Tax=Geranomyces variabilis TaxID=109894 RepID=A0AAD5TFF9_9FUNG|nr:hypothetical protein HDU87_006402 [Geranomyces variabilis]